MDISTEAVKALNELHDGIVLSRGMKKALDMLTAIAAERDALKSSNERLVEAASKADDAIEQEWLAISWVVFGAVQRDLRQAIAASRGTK